MVLVFEMVSISIACSSNIKNCIRIQRKNPGVEVTLDPSELADMDSETLQEKYEHGLQAARPEGQREETGDLLEEHLASSAKKRRQVQEKKSGSKDKNKHVF